MSSAAVRSLVNASRARLHGATLSFTPAANRLSASRATCTSTNSAVSHVRHSSASAAPRSTIASTSSASSSSSADSTQRLSSLAIVAAALSAACVTWYQLTPASSDATPAQPGKSGAPGLNSKEFTALKLKSVEPYNHNSQIYTFALPDPDSYLNLPVSSCIMLRGKGADGKDVIRPYTPIDTQRKGEVVLIIKTYPKGNLSQYVKQLKVGDTIDIKGPVPKLKYEENMKKKIGMLAGGTGIAPMLQVIEQIASNKDDHTEAHLVYANVSGKDVLLKETIDAITEQHPNIKVTYVIDSKDSDKDWAGEVGRINKDLIKRVIPFSPKDGKDVLIYVCGPPAFMKALSGDKAKDYSQGEVEGALKELGFNKDQVYKF